MIKKSSNKRFKMLNSGQLQVFLLFLIMSFFMLITTKLSKTYVQEIQLEVVYKNSPLQLVLPSADSFTISTTIKSSGFAGLYNAFSKNTLEIDFEKDVQRLDSVFQWNYISNQQKLSNSFQSAIEIIDVYPKQISIPFVQEYSKKVPIELNSQITFYPGYDFVQNPILVPDSILIVGSPKAIDTINYVNTELLQLNKLQGSYSGNIKLNLPKSSQIKISNTIVKTEILSEKFTEGSVDVPVNIINIPSEMKINYFPKRLTVIYYLPLSQYGKISASDFKIECDFKANYSDGSTFVLANLASVPEFIKRARLSNDKIEFIFLK